MPQPHSLKILPLLGWRHRVSKHLHMGGCAPAEPAATERSLCAGTGWDLLAGGFFQQCSCNMLHARLQTFLGQLSRTWINSGYMCKAHSVGSARPGGSMALPLHMYSLKGFLQAQMSPSVPGSTCADQFLLCTREIISACHTSPSTKTHSDCTVPWLPVQHNTALKHHKYEQRGNGNMGRGCATQESLCRLRSL